jgi:hypothetical protein
MVPLPRVSSHRPPFVGRCHPAPHAHHLASDVASIYLRESPARCHCIEASRLGAVASNPSPDNFLTARPLGYHHRYFGYLSGCFGCVIATSLGCCCVGSGHPATPPRLGLLHYCVHQRCSMFLAAYSQPFICKRLLEHVNPTRVLRYIRMRTADLCREILTLTRQRQGSWHDDDPCIYFIRACIKRSKYGPLVHTSLCMISTQNK